VAALLSLVGGATTAAAQEEDDQANVPVRERVHRHLQPDGIYFGSLLFYPKFTAGVEFDSNVFASSDNPSDDIVYVIAPKLAVLSQTETQQHALELAVRHREFDRFDSESGTEANAGLRSAWQLAEGLRLDSTLQAARTLEQRGDSFTEAGSATPIAYYDLRASAYLTRQFNDFGVTAGGEAKRLTYEDGETATGIHLDQSIRDGTIVVGRLKPFYEFSPGYRVYADLQVNQRNYEGEGARNRDSEGFDARGGVEFLLTPILFGAIEAGYLEQYYDNPLIPSARGPSGKAEISWLMTPLMTVSLFASRSTVEVAAPEQSARIDFTAGAQLDYEITRQLIASTSFAFTNEDFSGIERNDDVLRAEARIDYALNQYFSLGFKYRYTERDSNIEDFSFDRHLFLVNFLAQY
jgi:hypothetical protein